MVGDFVCGVDDDGVWDMGCGLLVCLFSIVVGVCVGLNPHISHCTCTPACA